MVRKEIKFKDGTRIYYEGTDENLYRYIEYSYTPKEREQIEKHPELQSIICSKVRKYKADRFYYLDVLYGIACKLNADQRRILYAKIKKVHDEAGNQYNPNIIKNFPDMFREYWPESGIQCAEFFVTIYLSMVDLEDGKKDYPHSLGKTMVLRSCEAVILKNTDPRDAAVMFKRKQKVEYDDELAYIGEDSPYAKYNGYNGYDDDTIDEAFEGDPIATWNVD